MRNDQAHHPTSALTEEQIAIVEMIKELLALALEGQILSVGLVGCKKEGFFSVMGGRQASDLNLALDHLKKQIIDTVDETSEERNSRRSIIRN